MLGRFRTSALEGISLAHCATTNVHLATSAMPVSTVTSVVHLAGETMVCSVGGRSTVEELAMHGTGVNGAWTVPDVAVREGIRDARSGGRCTTRDAPLVTTPWAAASVDPTSRTVSVPALAGDSTFRARRRSSWEGHIQCRVLRTRRTMRGCATRDATADTAERDLCAGQTPHRDSLDAEWELPPIPQSVLKSSETRSCPSLKSD